MILDGVIFLASFSSRARAYAQAMANAGFYPAHTVTFGDPARDNAAADNAAADGAKAGVIDGPDGALYLPDPSIPLAETLGGFPGAQSHVASANVNEAPVAAHLRGLDPKAVIYAGYGGQIVSAETLKVAPFVHMHAGWLPDYRGSTTAYYSWLDGEGCAVTALSLDPEIDTGAILLRKRYPAPPPETDIDHVYDSALRSDCLIRVLRHVADIGELPPAETQPAEGGIYYVMHPVLRHVARLYAPPGDWSQNR